VLKAIFFDLGSTLWDDYPVTQRTWEVLTRLLTQAGIEVSHADIVARAHEMIATYSPSLNRAVVWQYVDGDEGQYQRIMAELIEETKGRFADPQEFRRLNPLFPGVHQLLDHLSGQYALAVVSQHFAEVEDWMELHDIRKYFRHLSVSDVERLYKPDPRLFLLPCKALGVDPREVLMVGDRLDNDIWPANRLEMLTARVLADPYRVQQPRYPRDVPDFTIERIGDLGDIIEGIEARR
jgi:HAD superfamily hydrolase (TIGR01549 family)